MLQFNIDLSDTVNEFSLSDQDINSLSDYLLDRVVDEYVTQWERLIDDNLNTTRDEYKRAIYTDRPDQRTAIVGLTARESRLAMMIEAGKDAFDEKVGFEGSSKRHEKSNGGWYLTIPFRHATSENIMQLQVPGMGVSVLDLMKTGQTIGTQQLPEGFDEAQTHQLELNTGSVITYKHKAPIYEGLHRRNINSTLNEKRGGYFTFRRVSDKSDPDSWMHPGFTAHNFMDKALESSQLGEAVDNAVQDWLDKKFGD